MLSRLWRHLTHQEAIVPHYFIAIGSHKLGADTFPDTYPEGVDFSSSFDVSPHRSDLNTEMEGLCCPPIGLSTLSPKPLAERIAIVRVVRF